MKKILSILLILVLSLSVFTGCGKTENKAVEKEAEKTEETTEKEEEVAQEETVEAEEELGWPRTLTDARGVEVTIEKKPERIVSTDWSISEYLLVLDSPPIADAAFYIMRSWESTKHIHNKYEIEDLGSSSNFEKLAEVKPDLILTTEYTKDSFDQYEKVAPIFVFPLLVDTEWRIALPEFAKVLGKEKEAEEFIDNAKLEMEEAKKQLNELDESSVFLTIFGKTIYISSPESLSDFYDEDTGLGLKSPEGWDGKAGQISLEALVELDPDILFVNSDNEEELTEEINTNSVWQTINAVKNNKVYFTDQSVTTGGPLGNKYGISVIVEALTK